MIISSLFRREVWRVTVCKSKCDRRLFVMNSVRHSSYEEAIYALNGLQSNPSVLQKAKKERSANAHRNLTDTERHLSVLGIKAEDIDSLNIIHVSGTKGKGSTCAFAESILREHGFKTGFYSSPHLITVNERIRIDGLPIKKEDFALYFWHVYRSLQESQKNGESMPPYFMFLTVLAFYIFVKEKVDVAVVEVGIGGLYDCTNIIRTPIVVGVTTLGLDHVSILGDTIDKIAEQKAGIFKPNVPIFTVPQPDEAIRVSQRRAYNVGCPLYLCPDLQAYGESSFPLRLGVPGEVQLLNASLALQLCKTWLDSISCKSRVRNTDFSPLNVEEKEIVETPLLLAKPFPVSPLFCRGLQKCIWPGRFQSIKCGNITYYLDGAHTHQSMEYCSQWFEEASQEESSQIKGSVCRVLLFNCTGERNTESLLYPLSFINFDLAFFSPNQKTTMKDSASDQSNFMVDPEKEMERCKVNRKVWTSIVRRNCESKASVFRGSLACDSSSDVKHCGFENTVVFPCLSSVVEFLNSHSHCSSDHAFNDVTLSFKEASHIQVLVTGSLHLVGGLLSLIDPNLQYHSIPKDS